MPSKEHLNYTDYDDLADAHRQLKQWLEVEHMNERIHSSLGNLTPAELEAAAYTERLHSFIFIPDFVSN